MENIKQLDGFVKGGGGGIDKSQFRRAGIARRPSSLLCTLLKWAEPTLPGYFHFFDSIFAMPVSSKYFAKSRLGVALPSINFAG